jgi:hypothetical protein
VTRTAGDPEVQSWVSLTRARGISCRATTLGGTINMSMARHLASLLGTFAVASVVVACHSERLTLPVGLLTEKEMHRISGGASPGDCNSQSITNQCSDLNNCAAFGTNVFGCISNTCQRCTGDTSNYCSADKPWNALGCTAWTTYLNGCGKQYRQTACSMQMGTCACVSTVATDQDCPGSKNNQVQGPCFIVEGP